jgi:Spy/CpxP family protein refolding chaperone
MFRKLIPTILATAFALYGQVNSSQGNISTAIFPPPAAAFDELKQYLGLTDPQVEQLQKLLQERSDASQEVYRQIEQKQTELNGLLQSGSRDAARIGQLTIDIHMLSTQAPLPTHQWRQRALAILTPAQLTKLGTLDQAMKLSNPAYQAVTLDLIDAPPPGKPIIMEQPGLSILPAPGTPVPLPELLSSPSRSRNSF